MDDKLRTLQLVQLEMLKVFDAFCKEHQLRYSLYAGTLLGAVRHKGFIPWDDDLDVCMSREEYNLFLKYWQQSPPDGYILQNKDNSPNFTQSFSKIRKDNTAFIESENEIGKFHTGIFIDVFPIDRMPDGKLNRLFFKINCMKYQLLIHEFIPKKSSAIVRLISSLILFFNPKNNRKNSRQKLLKKITKNNDNKNLATVAIEIKSTWSVAHDSDLLDNYIYLQFEDGNFMCFKNWDSYLRKKFGKYMELPPETERGWRHHPVVLDFEHSYEEIVKNKQ